MERNEKAVADIAPKTHKIITELQARIAELEQNVSMHEACRNSLILANERIAELEQKLAEYGEHTKYCAVMHHPQNTVCTCGWKEIKK
jgi:BMFP domain-containing protein YqiC